MGMARIFRGKVWTKFSVLFLGLFIPFAICSSSAQATTPWDNLISTTSTLTVSNGTNYGGGPEYNITTSFASIMAEKCPEHPDGLGSAPAIEEFSDVLASPTGKWAIRQTSDPVYGNSVRISWIDSPTIATEFYHNPNVTPGLYSVRILGSRYVDLGWHNGDFTCFDLGYNSFGYNDLGISSHPGLLSVFVSTYPVNYPGGYLGDLLPGTPTLMDIDGDGVDSVKEQFQGTVDSNPDTDGDGIDDYKESVWFTHRNGVFCGISECAYPDPLKKDVFIEIDWMSDGSANRLFKPSSTQLAYIRSMFSSKDINIHLDTGQFGGGGVLTGYMHALPIDDSPGVVDFGDFKDGGDGVPSHFATNRRYIWKYLIYGYGLTKDGDPNYPDISGSTGIAEVSGDDIFVAGGVIQDTTGLVSADRAIANTIAHEIGHTLCLSPAQLYQEQDAACIYSGIDNDTYRPLNYLSVMNYRYQLTDDGDMGVVNYSSGLNGAGDHNDWAGVLSSMDDFNGVQTQMGSKRTLTKNKTMDPDKIVHETLFVEMDSPGKRQQAAFSLLADTQRSLDPPHISDAQVRALNKINHPDAEVYEDFDWVAFGGAGFAIAGGVGAWRMWRRK